MVSKSLIQFSVDGQGSVPSLLFVLRPNYCGGNEDNGDLFHKEISMHCQPQCLQSTPPWETPEYSWASLGQSLVGSLLLSPGSWCIQGLFVPFKSLFPQSCVSPGSSMVGLMATSSKRAYAIPWSAAPRAPQSPCGRPLTHISAGEVKWTFGSITTKKLVEVMEFQLSYSKS